MGRTIADVIQRITRNTNYPTVFFADSVTVGATEVQVLAINRSGWITIKAATDNADEITIGTSGVTDGDGYVLQPDEEVTVEHNKLSDIYAISGTADQEIHIIGSYKD